MDTFLKVYTGKNPDNHSSSEKLFTGTKRDLI